MTEEQISLPIRSALIPVFYQNFRCLAQDCRDTCCTGNWSIVFDKKDYLRLRRLDAPPALRERLDQEVRRVRKEDRGDKTYGIFKISPNSPCPFLGEDALCDIQRACGHGALPEVCKAYPRRTDYTSAAKEYFLSPSCEGVLHQLWDLPGGVEFVEEPLPKAAWRSGFIPQTENLLLYFAPVRGAFIDVLQNRAMPLTERILCLGVLIQRLQNEDWENFDLDGWEKRAAALIESGVVAKMDIPGNRGMYLAQNVGVLSALSVSEDWVYDIYKALEVSGNLALRSELIAPGEFNFSQSAYAEALAQFKAAFSDHEYFFENLMVAVALFLRFPTLNSKEELWKSYVSLCNLYSFFRFVSVLGCKDEATKERLFHMIVMASRHTLHDSKHFIALREELFAHDSSTLAHMAILLRWD